MMACRFLLDFKIASGFNRSIRKCCSFKSVRPQHTTEWITKVLKSESIFKHHTPFDVHRRLFSDKTSPKPDTDSKNSTKPPQKRNTSWRLKFGNKEYNFVDPFLYTEITMKEFFQNYLPSGKVKQVEVVNDGWVRVELVPGSDIDALKRLWFRIENSGNFERNLEKAQIEMNLKPSEFITVIHTQQLEGYRYLLILPLALACALIAGMVLKVMGVIAVGITLKAADVFIAGIISIAAWVIGSAMKAAGVFIAGIISIAAWVSESAMKAAGVFIAGIISIAAWVIESAMKAAGVLVAGIISIAAWVIRSATKQIVSVSDSTTGANILNEDTGIRFSDVAGCEEAKLEIMEFVNFLKNPQKYHELGAKVPKGAILTGPPGTGKTLLAKATAGEANVPFISVSGSEFTEILVGASKNKVRQTFDLARENAPCILFIDEIDSLGRNRTGGNIDQDKTLNQLLVEMDGIDPQSGVVVLAATNSVDMVDPALLRPGRFDRHIDISLPDIKGRTSIFKVQLSSFKTELSISDLAPKLADLTPRFSGADIAKVCNEAALIAARDNKTSIQMTHFEQAIERVLAG